ncbi:multicopper oxidase family protein [Chengkuizengella axinellae]|uniref:Multicopper oxidase family protein n=1 Tax=Chengkuizengella axinellae TaxID=3064388 RepID=A0ABT9J675_9BACL|nr:multicopper oxidase family protein [Chengkuizengella sp. 2205SS18-9]MDP5277053.1 multicopper oxidase family protein [Chengkuizengella sp. 2205SS18-9]
MKIRYILIAFTIALLSILVGLQLLKAETLPQINKVEQNLYIRETEEDSNPPIKEFNIATKVLDWDFGKGTMEQVWTYNGTVPGEEIRVTEGDTVKVNLHNTLPEPVTIHWHGMVLPNTMDGVAGLTQNAVKPGEMFTYEFIANKAGTYWYHSHQDSANQVDKGLYGAFVIEKKEISYDQDFVLMLDEWSLPIDINTFLTNDDQEVNYDQLEDTPLLGTTLDISPSFGDSDTEMLYNAFTVNGKLFPDIQPILVNQGETVRLRIINSGYMKHWLDFGKQSYKIVAADASDIQNPILTTNILEIAPSERIDIEFEAENKGLWYLQSADLDFASSDMRVPIIIDGSNHAAPQKIDYKKDILRPTEYKTMDPLFLKDDIPTFEYEMILNADVKWGEGLQFTINEKAFPETIPLKVNEGDLVKVKMINESIYDHPMHLHGHPFQVISKNGNPLEQALIKDVINILPGEEYEIMFRADNPGHWMFHCHDLLHAEGGMKTTVKYNDYTVPYLLN